MLKDLEKLNFEELGLVCGIEIHQQLDTKKLFCSCPCEIVPNESLDKEVRRNLRFSLSETGTIDETSLQEFKKGKYNIYKFNDKISCLVDLDEEPPKGPNKLALKTALTLGKMFNLTFFDKIQFMRKIIIDGSITTGFQRTAMFGINGKIKTSFGEVSIDAMNLEEDSSRVISRSDDHSIFSLDRQGIPLIEITTGPHMKTPLQAQEVATQLGNALRSFKETKRGLGTIRQDLNVSIKGGARVEIKGAQNLKLIPEVIEAEMRRQKILLSIIEEVKSRGIKPNDIGSEVVDITKIFEKSTSKVILENLKIKGSGVFTIKLKNFKGILGHEIQQDYRFASEVSDRNKKQFPQIKGLFHSDELPKYGITEEEVSSVRDKLKLDEEDSFILIVNEKKLAIDSLSNVQKIIKNLISEVEGEVRQVDPKGTKTIYLRPMPGSSRMYPETDIQDIILDDKYLNSLTKEIPELYNKKLERLEKQFEIEPSKIEEVMEKFSEEELFILIKISDKKASQLYNLLFELPKDIKKREKVEIFDFKFSLLEDLLRFSKENDVNQNTIRDIFVSLYKDNLDHVKNIKDYIESKGLIQDGLDEKEVEETIKKIVEENQGAPFGALMGHAMKAFQGKVDGKKISELLKKLSN